MPGSWIFDSTLLVLHLKPYFHSPIQTIYLPPARYSIVSAIAVSWQTLRVRCYYVSTSYLNIGLSVADSQTLYCCEHMLSPFKEHTKYCAVTLTLTLTEGFHQLDGRHTVVSRTEQHRRNEDDSDLSLKKCYVLFCSLDQDFSLHYITLTHFMYF